MSGAGLIDPRFVLARQGQSAGNCGSPNSMCCKLGQPGIVFPGLGGQIGSGTLGTQIISNNVPVVGAVPQAAVISPGSSPANIAVAFDNTIKNPGDSFKLT